MLRLRRDLCLREAAGRKHFGPVAPCRPRIRPSRPPSCLTTVASHLSAAPRPGTLSAKLTVVREFNCVIVLSCSAFHFSCRRLALHNQPFLLPGSPRWPPPRHRRR